MSTSISIEIYCYLRNIEVTNLKMSGMLSETNRTGSNNSELQTEIADSSNKTELEVKISGKVGVAYPASSNSTPVSN